MKTGIRLSILALVLLLNGFVAAQVVNPVMPAVVSPSAPPAVANPGPIPGGGILTFEEETHNFGDLEQGGDASFLFKFRNTGTEDIIITAAKPGCGCTTPTWPKEAIKPGEWSEIPVKYDSNRLGGFDKWVTIISNASETEKKIYIKGNILAKPTGPDMTSPIQGPVATPAPHN
jgi:Protein of unknown function (DUF1573)